MLVRFGVLALFVLCTPATTKYFGYYAGHDGEKTLEPTFKYSNLYQANSIADALEASKSGLKSLLSVYGDLWKHTKQGLELNPDYERLLHATADAAKQAGMTNSTHNGPILGFNLGDELVWNCLAPVNLTRGSDAVRKLFPRGEAIIWYNEAAIFSDRQHYDHCRKPHPDYKIPRSLDWFSVDIYHMDGLVEGWVDKYVRGYYEKYLYPNMTKDQHAFLVPGAFGSKVNHYPNGTYVCDNHCYDVMCAHDATDFFNWAKNDARVVAVMPWNWSGCPGCNGSRWTPPHTCCMDEIGAMNQPLTRKAWAAIGKKLQKLQ